MFASCAAILFVPTVYIFKTTNTLQQVLSELLNAQEGEREDSSASCESSPLRVYCTV